MKKIYVVIETTDYSSNIIGIFEDENDAKKLCNSVYTHIEVCPYNLYAKDEYFNRVVY